MTNGEQQREVYVIPKSFRKAIVLRYHDLSSHFGGDKTVKRISNYFYFPKMRRYVKFHIRNCLECILSKRKSGRQAGELNPIPPGNRPFEIVHIDNLGPFITTTRKNSYIIGSIDILTKYAYIRPVRNVKATTTVQKVEEFILTFGAPRRVIIDRGTSFTSQGFQALCEKYQIRHTLNSTRHPQANGLIERLNQTLLPLMKCSIDGEESDNWDLKLKKIERDINSMVSVATEKSPYEALYGYLPRFEDCQTRDITVDCETYRCPVEIQKEIRESIRRTQSEYKSRYDVNRLKNITFKQGDIVFIKKSPIATGFSTKLQKCYSGPLVVTKVESSNTYRLKKLNKINDRGYETTAHVSQLKIWIGNQDSECESDNM